VGVIASYRRASDANCNSSHAFFYAGWQAVGIQAPKVIIDAINQCRHRALYHLPYAIIRNLRYI
jgi:hypothetical protein